MIFKRTRDRIVQTQETPPQRSTKPEPTVVPAQGAVSDEDRISRIASSSIALSKLAPRLAALATEMAEGAVLQARESTQIAEQASNMSRELEAAIESLKASSGSVGGIVQSIKKLADQSKILALNAGIEAAKAGKNGRAFGAVAIEVESLASRTSLATSDIGEKVGTIEKSIQRAVTAAGLQGQAQGIGESGPKASIRGFGEKVDSIASVARQSSASASVVAETGKEMRTLCEELLLSVGSFRIQAHVRAAKLFDQIANNEAVLSGKRLSLERYLEDCMKRFRIFEIFYMTDSRGVQVSENVWFDEGKERPRAYGTDWSSRDWFLRAVNDPGVSKISDIYHSIATDNYCFTVSKAVRNRDGNIVGVLAGDVNFASLLEAF